ncbi:hypothetical protein VTN77DRAFT_98 [Rasamsonia byssochlamydoides]|uniref:uncharacterized protein n=1 Tax=Rasamsonia byssochlamydoides TaxID=89139 RepID=UPI0037431269
MGGPVEKIGADLSHLLAAELFEFLTRASTILINDRCDRPLELWRWLGLPRSNSIVSIVKVLTPPNRANSFSGDRANSGPNAETRERVALPVAATAHLRRH